jgi:hypothetical protein
VEADGQEVRLADGSEHSVSLTAHSDAQALSGTERRLLVRWRAAQVAHRRAMEQRLKAAEAAQAGLLLTRGGKARPTTAAEAQVAVAAMLEGYQVNRLLAVSLQAPAHTRSIRP